MVSRTPSERSRAKGGLWSAIPTTSRSLDVGARSCPEADRVGLSSPESPTGHPPGGRPTPRTTSRRRRWSPHVFTLRSTAGMSLTGGKLYSFMSGQGCASASIPREAGWERENQRGHWVVSCDLPYGSSASIPLTWVSVLTRSPPLGSGPPGHGPLSGTKTCPKKKLARMPVLVARPGAPLAIDVRHTAAMLSIPTMTCEWNFLPSGTEESDRELDEPLSTPGRLCAGWGTCLTRHGKPVVPRKPLLTQRGKHPSLSFGDDRLPPYVLHSGENWGPATLKGSGNRCLKLLVGEGMAKMDEYPGT